MIIDKTCSTHIHPSCIRYVLVTNWVIRALPIPIHQHWTWVWAWSKGKFDCSPIWSCREAADCQASQNLSNQIFWNIIIVSTMFVLETWNSSTYLTLDLTMQENRKEDIWICARCTAYRSAMYYRNISRICYIDTTTDYGYLMAIF